MAKFFDKIKIKTGLQAQRNKFDLSCQNLTTQDFFVMKPVYSKEMIPGEKISINMHSFTRLSPLVNPMMAQCKVVNRAFFVPFRTVWKPWTNFITDTPYEGVTYTNVRRFSRDAIVSAFGQISYGWSRELKTGEIADFYNGNDGRKFTVKGKRIFDLIVNLGYNVNLASTTENIQYFSALPLLAFVKIYYDWYRNPQYPMPALVEGYLSSLGDINTVTFVSLLDWVYRISITNDYFTAAFDNPMGPNVQTTSNIIMNDNSYVNDDLSTSTNSVVYNGNDDSHGQVNAPVLSPAGEGDDSYITQQGLSML